MTSPDDLEDERVEDLMQVIDALDAIANAGISDGTLHVGDAITAPYIEERIARMGPEEMKMFRQRANGKAIGADYQFDWNDGRQGYDLGVRVKSVAHK